MTFIRRWSARVPEGLGEAIWIVLCLRIALFLFGIFVASERTIPHPCHFEEARNGWAAMPLQYKDGLAFKLFGVWERWDACWYANIATFGYHTDGGTAFFPLFPMLERILALGGPHVVIAGMLINLVLTVLAMWGLYRIVRRDHRVEIAQRTLLLVMVFPAALFVLAPFSEATFLVLAIWSIETAMRGAWGWTALLAALCGLSRPVGGLIALPLLWLALPHLRSLRPPAAAASLLAVAAAPAGGIAYVVYTQNVVGRSMFDASAQWGTASFHPPWEVAAATLAWIGRTGDPIQALNLGLLVLFAALFVLGIPRLPIALTLYTAPQLYLAWARILPTPLTSTSRHLIVIFPAFIVLALLLGDRRWRWSYVILSLLLLGALANEFVVGNFVG